MGSIRGAHNVSNELAEVLVTSAVTASHNWAGNTIGLSPHVLVAGRNYRVIEVGFTVLTAGTHAAAIANAFDIGTGSDPDGLVDGASVPAGAAMAVGNSISTSRGGVNTISFVLAGTGLVDSEGIGRVTAGDYIRASGVTNVVTGGPLNGPSVIFYARLAPEIVRDFDN
jgi:hypothetical protein